MALVVRLEEPGAPLVEGIAKTLELRVENAGKDPAVLSEAVLDGPRDRGFEWRKPPFGVVLYDAAKDGYAHFTDAPSVGPVPLDRGLLPPGLVATTYVAPKPLGAGRRTLRVTVRYREIPLEEVAARLYRAPSTWEARSTRYGTAPDTVADGKAGTSIVRAGDRPEQTAVLETTLEVLADATSPSSHAALHGRVVDRSKALGAWVVVSEEGEVLAIGPGGRRSSFGHLVDPEVFSEVDLVRPGDPVTLVLRGERAAKLEAALPVSGRGRGQLWFERTAIGEVLGRLVAAGLRVTFGRHAVGARGLVAEHPR